MADHTQAASTSTFLFRDRLYECYIFDLDGTIYLGDNRLPGAKRLIEKLRELGKKVVFVSNNPTRDPKMYAEKLTRLDLHTQENEIVNTVVTLRQWLLQN
jgi:ribonucleotide monophosphatase NagD (HAD superfamily)